MATHGARRLGAMTANALNVVAIEFLAACQGIDLRAPLKTSARLQGAYEALRLKVPFAPADRLLALDIEAAAAVLRAPEVQSLADDPVTQLPLRLQEGRERLREGAAGPPWALETAARRPWRRARNDAGPQSKGSRPLYISRAESSTLAATAAAGRVQAGMYCAAFAFSPSSSGLCSRLMRS